MTVIEGNKLIAEFMNIKVAEYCHLENTPYGLVVTDAHGETDFKYGIDWYHPDINWNQLMPVVEKISAIPLIGATVPSDVCHPRTFGMPDYDGNLMVRLNGSSICYGKTLIEATWIAVVEFIKLYNQKNPL